VRDVVQHEFVAIAFCRLWILRVFCDGAERSVDNFFVSLSSLYVRKGGGVPLRQAKGRTRSVECWPERLVRVRLIAARPLRHGLDRRKRLVGKVLVVAFRRGERVELVVFRGVEGLGGEGDHVE
jgi:hypothetical protein